MGRPTEERKEKTVKLRISGELYEEIEGCGDNLSETIRGFIREGLGVKKHGKIPKGDCVPQKGGKELEAALLLRCEGKSREIFERSGWNELTIISNEEYEKLLLNGENVPQNTIGMESEHYADLVKMCEVSGLSIGRFMEYIYRLFSSGKIYIDGLVVKTRGECDVRELEDICHRVNVDPQDMIDRLVKGLLRG